MPYPTLASLPTTVKKLAKHAQEIWRAAWNSAFKQYGEEERAFKVAWAAVRKWQQGSFHMDFKRILSLFLKRYPEEGEQKFYVFVTGNGLNPEKPYNPDFQLRESFQWTEPLIQYYKQDKDAKYWKVLCLTCNISMNNNDYSDYTKMQVAAPTMNYRPVNINHNHKRWLPYPRTRMDFAVADELAVEGILRVDNEDKWLQDELKAGKYKQPSIEGRPIPDHMGGGYHFTGIALLEKGVELPGDPLTFIEPLMLNEKIGKATCKLINGKVVCSNINLGEKTMSENNNLLEQVDHPTDPPLPKSCVCPKCGTVVDNPKKHCEVTLCPKCQGQMKVNPKQNEPQPTGGKGHLPDAKVEARTEEQRAMAHFKISPVDWAKLSDEQKKTYIDKLPPRGTAGETQELFRDPLGKTGKAHPRFKSAADGLKVVHKDVPLREQLVETLKQVADLTEKNLELQKDYDELNSVNIAQTRQIEKFKDDFEKQARLIRKMSKKAEIVQELMTRSSDAETKLEDALADLTRSKKNTQVEKTRRKDAEKETSVRDEKIIQLNVKVDKIRQELNEQSEKRATSNQKATNALKEKADIQLENADLRTDNAKLTRKISDLSTKMAVEAKVRLQLETEIAEVKQEIAAVKVINGSLEKAKKSAVINSKKTLKAMKDAGYVRVRV